MAQSKAVALFVSMAALASAVSSRVGGSVFIAIGRSFVTGGGGSEGVILLRHGIWLEECVSIFPTGYFIFRIQQCCQFVY